MRRTTSSWGVAPRDSIEAACRDRGKPDVVAGCLALLAGGDADVALIRSLGGPHAEWNLDHGPEHRYWLRVWGARGLLWAWDDAATPTVIAALADESWRVREMALKVIARHRVDDALEAVTLCAEDPVPRVGAAAARALQRLTQVDDT
jgi:HEAT repeat protein